jgi:hypothetical protein
VADEDDLKKEAVRVGIEMQGASGLLKPEMTGAPKIFYGQRWLLNLLMRDVARYIRVEFWSWW